LKIKAVNASVVLTCFCHARDPSCHTIPRRGKLRGRVNGVKSLQEQDWSRPHPVPYGLTFTNPGLAQESAVRREGMDPVGSRAHARDP